MIILPLISLLRASFASVFLKKAIFVRQHYQNIVLLSTVDILSSYFLICAARIVN